MSGELFHEESLVLVVGTECDVVLGEETFCVRVNDEYGVAAGVQQDGVGGFGADAPEGKEFGTAGGGGPA